MSARDGLARWFAAKGYAPWPFQRAAWAAWNAGRSGLIHVPTGSGKTLAAFGAPLAALRPHAGLQVLYVSPLRAVIGDVTLAVAEVVGHCAPGARVEARTGDTGAATRARQRARLPDVLLTTPESLSLLLTRADLDESVGALDTVIVDEWHELLGTKRGVQVELALAHLRARRPSLRAWALSGTLRDLPEAARAVAGVGSDPLVVTAAMARPVELRTVLPDEARALPWAGHLGQRMLPSLLRVLDPERSTLLFTNTRSQAERWFRALLHARPEMAGSLALHHGSIDADARAFVERAVKEGSLRWVVCTSSLDLGVDFGPVDRVVQIGSPKGVARMMQRAGRASHRPQTPCTLWFVPTHCLEAAEIAAVRACLAAGEVESRASLRGAADVLMQHVVTLACARPIDVDAVFAEVRSAVAYESLSRETFDALLRHLVDGGEALAAYPQYRRVEWREGLLAVASPRVATLHRMNVGTIVSSAAIEVRFTNGRTLGQMEESFVARLRPGDRFLFAGRTLEFVRLRDLTAHVRAAKGNATLTPRWQGTSLPLSPTLSLGLRRVVDALADGRFAEPERAVLDPLFAVQRRVSRVPRESELLVEVTRSREGTHAFVFPFEGRLAHEGLAAVVATRLARRQKVTFGLGANDHGFELLAEGEFPFAEVFREHAAEVLGEAAWLDDLTEGMALGEFERRHFREVARVSGLVFQGRPGAARTAKQLHVSASLLHDVLRRHEPGHPLLEQTAREVLEMQLESRRIAATLRRLSALTPVVVETARFSPLAYPLVHERMAAKVGSESLDERLERMMQRWTRP
ncbi:MAG: ligase-associated box helicase [Myxococcaceae bacterium]|nr:ligase-associated box helicase [Myxococcaceae bacterium]